MPKCQRCPAEVPAEATRCPVCAAPLSAPASSAPPMNENESSSAPNFTKAGMGAMGDVNNVYDASQNTTNNSSNTSHTHHEDKSQHVDQSVTKQTTINNAGISNKVVVGIIVAIFAIICVVIAGFVLQTLALRAPQRDATVSVDAPGMKNRASTLADKDAMTSAPVPVQITINNQTAASATPTPSAAPQALTVALNQPSYKVGEEMHITVTSPQAGYLYVLAVWADGRVDTLFPNSLRPDAKVAAGTTLRLPDDFPPNERQERLTYPMSMPALSGNPASATESILAVLSPAPLDLPKSTELESLPGFAAVGVMDDPDFRTRGPQPKFIKMQKAPMLDFGTLPQAAVHYEIRR
jgi:hypothetical protein